MRKIKIYISKQTLCIQKRYMLPDRLSMWKSTMLCFICWMWSRGISIPMTFLHRTAQKSIAVATNNCLRDRKKNKSLHAYANTIILYHSVKCTCRGFGSMSSFLPKIKVVSLWFLAIGRWLNHLQEQGLHLRKLCGLNLWQIQKKKTSSCTVSRNSKCSRTTSWHVYAFRIMHQNLHGHKNK